MTVAELITLLQQFPSDLRVTLWDPDEGGLLPLRVYFLAADGKKRQADFVGVTCHYGDPLEGDGPDAPRYMFEEDFLPLTPPAALP